MRGARALLVALCCAGIASGTTSAAECPPLPAPYVGSIFDAAVQAWDADLGGLFPSLATAGVRRIALFANSKAGGAETTEAVEAAARAYPHLIVLGAPKIGFIRGGDVPDDFVSATLSGVTSGRYRFIGEILYTHGDKPDHPPTRTGDIYVDPLATGTSRLLAGLKGRNIPLLTHWEAWAWERDRPRFDRLYASWPAQRFVLPSLAYGSPDKTDAILSAHPNVWGIISRLVDGRYKLVDPAKQAKLGPSMTDTCGALLPGWRTVLVKYSDRLMYGSDDYSTARIGWDIYPRVIAKYRSVAGQLPPDVARKISWDNAAALYGPR